MVLFACILKAQDEGAIFHSSTSGEFHEPIWELSEGSDERTGQSLRISDPENAIQSAVTISNNIVNGHWVNAPGGRVLPLVPSQ